MISLELQVVCAILLDALLGDPHGWPHPVRWIGSGALICEKPLRNLLRNDHVAGVVTVVLVVAGVAGITWGLLHLAGLLNPWASDVLGILVIYSCLATRDLARHASAVAKPLLTGNMELARQRVSRIVGRDTDGLDSAGVTRATLESVGENLIDGVTAPLLFAVCFGPIGAIAYKAINTLDSTFGYKNDRYIRFGWASAKLDDWANWLPARLTLPCIAIAAGVLRFRWRSALVLGWRDRQKHASPNSAYGEAALAGALGVQLGGPTCYQGQWVDYPTLGESRQPLEPTQIPRANRLLWATLLVFAVFALAIRWGVVHLIGGLS